MRIPLLLIISFFATSAFAAQTTPAKKYFGPAYKEVTEENVLKMVPEFATAGFDQKKLEESVASRKVSRQPASRRTYSDADLTEDMKKFRDKFLKVKTAKELDALLTEADENYDHYSPDLKFFVAQFVLIKPFRSIIHRLRPLVEHNRAVQSSAVTTLRGLASSLKIYLPSDQWEAGFEYAATPGGSAETDAIFTSIHDFQNYLVSTGPQYYKASARIAELYKNRGEKPFVLDNKILFGPGTFEDSLERYRVYDLPEMAAALGTIHSALHSMDVFCAYNQDDLMQMFYEQGKLRGIDGFFHFGEPGVTVEDQMKIYNKSKYKKFLTLRGKLGTRLMADALQNLGASVYYFDAAWRHLDQMPENEYALLNPVSFQPSKRGLDLRFKNMKEMVAAKTPIRSAITGEVVDIDLPTFFKAPPQDLKKLMATEYDQGPAYRMATAVDGKSIEYRNYYRGRPTGWDNQAWATYVPSVAGKPSGEMATVIRVLQESWGGAYLAPTLDSMIR